MSKEKINILREGLKKISQKESYLMEVCGTHTMSIAKNGIRSMLPENVHIVSGPGCPVCVTSQGDIELSLQLARRDDVIITTFGDMLKVPSKGDSLQNYKNVKIVYSPLESLKIANENPDKEVVFIGVGFETTTPLIASTILEANKNNIKNFSVLPMHKLVPPALEVIFSDPEVKINGLILPGHVSAITGTKYFNYLEGRVSGVVSNFEALGMMESIYLLVKDINDNKKSIMNNYPKVVTKEGNHKAMDAVTEVYEEIDVSWRGIGVIPKSGLGIKKEYAEFDAAKKFNLNAPEIEDPKGCLCGAILMGKTDPYKCKHFGKSCTPTRPVGPCMVSSEGTCAAYYKYFRDEGENNHDK